jgi:hypothetical protein
MASRVPLVMRLKEQILARGKHTADDAEEIALKTLEQRGHIDGDGRLTLQGQARQDLGAAGRAKDRAARYAGRSPDQYAYNPATNRATLRVRS